jgi:DNA-binding NarL/FixJ family response regulator
LGDVERADEIRASLSATAAHDEKALWYWGLEAHIASRRGELHRARDAIAELVRLAAQRGGVEAQLASDVVAAALAAGIEPDALSALGALTLTSERTVLNAHRPTQPSIVDATEPRRQLVNAQLLESRGEFEDALAAYHVALEGEDWLRPMHLGLAGTGGARSALALGRLDEAREHAKKADAALARWPGWRRNQLEAVQRRLGLGAVIDGPDALTPREREVAALLAEGLTNAELARRLYISPKTAAVHVSNILAKLGMASRTEVAAWAVREGVTA